MEIMTSKQQSDMIHYYIENLKTIFTVLQQFAPQNNT